MQNFLISTNFPNFRELSTFFKEAKEENIIFYKNQDFHDKKICFTEMYILQTTGNPYEDNILFFRLREFITENLKKSVYLIFSVVIEQTGIFWEGYIKEGNIQKLSEEEELKFNLPPYFSIGKFTKIDIDKILVCSLAIGTEYKKAVNKGVTSKKMYCLQHNYDFRDDEDVYDSSRPIAWSKIPLLLRYLCKTNHDYIVWFDADTFIMNPNRTIEDIIQDCSGDADILVSRDAGEINTGVMFIKNNEWCRDYIKKIWSMTDFIFSSNWEQDAFIHLYKTNYNDAKKHIRIISNQKVFNSFWYQYEPGDFIIHFAGCSRLDNFHGLEGIMDQCCPYRLKTETYQNYQARLEYQARLVQINLDNQKREREEEAARNLAKKEREQT